MVPLVLGALAGAILVATAVFAALTARWERDCARRLERVARPPDAERAYKAVVNARSAFTRSVQAYEEALAATGAGASGGTLSTGTFAPGDIAEIERVKDERRAKLVGAQRAWDAVRPADGPDSRVAFWIGAGVYRGWSFGPVGREVAFIRLEHGIDPSCWVIVRTSRRRFGLGVGGESLRLGVLVDGANIDQLLGLVQLALGGSELALRPGVAPLRRRRNRNRPGLVVAKAQSGEPTMFAVLERGIGTEARQAAGRMWSLRHGVDVSTSRALPASTAQTVEFSMAPVGRSLVAGAWSGRNPAARIIVGSNHRPWVRPPG